VRDNVTMVTVVIKVTMVIMITISNHGYFTINQMFFKFRGSESELRGVDCKYGLAIWVNLFDLEQGLHNIT